MLSSIKLRSVVTLILAIFVVASLAMSFLPSPTIGPSATSTPLTGGTICSPVTSTITAPFTFDGVGDFCWQSDNLGAFINSWNTTSVTINGINVTNVWLDSSSYPAQIDGSWYIMYSSSAAWGHFEANYR